METSLQFIFSELESIPMNIFNIFIMFLRNIIRFDKIAFIKLYLYFILYNQYGFMKYHFSRMNTYIFCKYIFIRIC